MKQALVTFILGILIVGLVGYYNYGGFFSSKGDAHPRETVRFSTIKDLDKYFTLHEISVEKWRAGEVQIPRILIQDIPSKWPEHALENVTVEKKKALFLRFSIPLVLIANEEIKAERKTVMRFLSKTELDDGDKKRVRRLAQKYKLDEDIPLRKLLAQLKTRVGPIPVSMGVAQMIEESGWGTSRFAIEGNALFGQWSFSKGMKPKEQRAEKGDYRIRSFKTPLDSVRAYILNLNTNQAYAAFRKERSRRLNAGEALKGASMIAFLKSYSERGEEYISSIRSIIASNKLAPFDRARLSSGPTVEFIPSVFAG
ncbi:glucosaminidase domain-containing protein [Sneathiella aquimaris]|uniref:glucosaminidase domain-containing protein n=1 Tax=Sneathiella aquimaris TaxID=2599305 RepID=UPI00146A7EBC|nr:glucosaminidase domain-containing protein [Sneathiella aquimaris]